MKKNARSQTQSEEMTRNVRKSISNKSVPHTVRKSAPNKSALSNVRKSAKATAFKLHSTAVCILLTGFTIDRTTFKPGVKEVRFNVFFSFRLNDVMKHINAGVNVDKNKHFYKRLMG